MKKMITVLLIIACVASCSLAQADMINIPPYASSAIKDMSTSVEVLFASKNDVLSMMANLVMLDYSAYDKTYVPDYTHDTYVGKTDTILYFAIPNSKGIYSLFGYLPGIDTLVYLGNDSRLNSAKEAEYILKGSCDSVKRIKADEMLEGANNILGIF
ncbi:MAG: hypothetical protein Q4G00_10635 [Clostridia bacterium]|nr:hypothetical protein [Clostridia bacterium]